jgi:hypothetical protein
VPVGRAIAQVVDENIQHPAADCPADNPFLERATHHPREDGDDVELHRLPPGSFN